MGHPPRTERHKQPTRIEFHVKQDKLSLNAAYGRAKEQHPWCFSSTELLEIIPDSADKGYTIEQAELAHRYGTPWPVSANLTNRRYGKPTGGNLTTVAKGTHQ